MLLQLDPFSIVIEDFFDGFVCVLNRQQTQSAKKNQTRMFIDESESPAL